MYGNPPLCPIGHRPFGAAALLLLHFFSVKIAFPHLMPPLTDYLVSRGVIKTKLRNCLAIPMVKGILATQHGLKRRNETCTNMIILPSMLAKFNSSMYSYKVTEPQGQRDIANANADSQEADTANENADIVEVLNDVEALLGKPIFITNWMSELRNENF